MPTLYATCGLSFAGKTTLARRLAQALDIRRVSLDEINRERGLDGGQGIADAQWEITSEIAMKRLGDILVSGQSVVLDDTLSHRFLRDRYRDVAIRARAYFVLVLVDTPIAEITQRIENNRLHPIRSTINDDVFTAHKNRFQWPTEEEQPVILSSKSDIDCFLASVTKDNGL